MPGSHGRLKYYVRQMPAVQPLTPAHIDHQLFYPRQADMAVCDSSAEAGRGGILGRHVQWVSVPGEIRPAINKALRHSLHASIGFVSHNRGHLAVTVTVRQGIRSCDPIVWMRTLPRPLDASVPEATASRTLARRSIG